jgi:pimeloyl-ACP methyl ester carboxylesterase
MEHLEAPVGHGSRYITFMTAGRRLMALLVSLLSSLAAAQDYAREDRWKSEVVGNLVVGDAVQIAGASGRPFLGLYTQGEQGRPAVLLVHGIGVHPDHGIIGSLRMRLADMGFSTLSIQMPVLAADAQSADYYPALFPEASERIRAGNAWLASRRHSKVVLASHSLGSWMAQYHLEKEKPAFAAWISMGRSGPVAPLPLPVLDVYGEKDNPAVLKTVQSRRGARQVMIPGADHFYAGKEDELARLLREFIETVP